MAGRVSCDARGCPSGLSALGLSALGSSALGLSAGGVKAGIIGLLYTPAQPDSVSFGLT